jgi:NADPH:quinone reductase-like Zn-dependent oxidoreductase
MSTVKVATTTDNGSMLAWQATAYGSPGQVLDLRAIPRPEPGPGQLRIRVEAASLNPIDYKLLRGDLKAVIPLKFPVTLGFDACGLVDALGEDCEGFREGDRVFVRGSRDTLGAFAQYTVQPAKFVARAPVGSSAVASASLPLVALTTVQGLVDRAQAKPGQRVLIHAGSGGLGSFAIQYARRLGLVVEATCSARNEQMVKALGADRVLVREREDYRTRGAVYDIVFDSLGGKDAVDAFAVLKPGGCVVSVAGPPDAEMIARFGRNPILRAVMSWMSRKVRKAAKRKGARYFRYLTESNGAQLQDIAALVEAGAIKPVVDRVFPFDQAVAAFDYLMTGHARGKIVLDVEGRDAAPE